MFLYDTLNLLCTNSLNQTRDTVCGERNIKLREYRPDGEGRIFCDEKVKDLLEYMDNHNDLNLADGYPVQVRDVKRWTVVEILVDKTRKEDEHLPDYNKGKIIVII